MNILITGSNGQLGNEMRVLSEQHQQHRYWFTDVEDLAEHFRDAGEKYMPERAQDLVFLLAMRPRASH